MSKHEIGEILGEQDLANRTQSTIGLLFALAAKYGPLCLVCAWLLWVQREEHRAALDLTERVTAALVQSSAANAQVAAALERLQRHQDSR